MNENHPEYLPAILTSPRHPCTLRHLLNPKSSEFDTDAHPRGKVIAISSLSMKLKLRIRISVVLPSANNNRGPSHSRGMHVE